MYIYLTHLVIVIYLYMKVINLTIMDIGREFFHKLYTPDPWLSNFISYLAQLFFIIFLINICYFLNKNLHFIFSISTLHATT